MKTYVASCFCYCARNYFYGQRFDQAIGVLERLLAEQPTDIASRVLLIETLTKTNASTRRKRSRAARRSKIHASDLT